MVNLTLPLYGSDQLLFCTARIECSNSVGTAFFMNFSTNSPGMHVPCLITNKHVVEGFNSCSFFVHIGEFENGDLKKIMEPIRVTIQNLHEIVFFHPNNDTDLCLIPFEPLREQAENKGKKIFYRSLDESLIPSEETLRNLLALEEVTMIGYPNGLWDEKNNFPLLRRGSTATHPAVDFNNRPIACVDIACIPGSSGSPIVLFNEGTFKTRGNVTVGSRALLLGVLFAGPVMSVDGNIRIEEIPTTSKPVFNINQMIHLGYYIKAKELLLLKSAFYKKAGII